MRMWLLLSAVLVAAPVRVVIAHHSRAHFDMDALIEIDGTVTEVSWRSPHVYYRIDVTAVGTSQSGTWTLEGHSIPGFARLGWTRETLQLGDRVRIAAHPNRDADKPFAMLYSATDAAGATHYAYAIPDGVDVPEAPDRSATVASTDYGGTWRYLIPVREAAIGSFRPPTEWPLTATGRGQVERFDINDDPVLDCAPMGVPRLILATYSHNWRREADRIVIEKERSTQVRTIHLGDVAVPADFESDQLGFSRGHFLDDGTLIVETDHFAPERWGNARGLDSSERKRVIERYRLIDGGFGMAVEYTIEDPVYLSEPVTVRGNYSKSADYEFIAEQCDPAVARRHLTE